MHKSRNSMDVYNYMPYSKRMYLKANGYHFNKKAYEWAVGRMYKMVNGREEKVTPITKERLDEFLKKNNVKVENNVLYDGCYVYCMALADFYGKSLPNEQTVALYVRDVIDDVDQKDGYVFNRFLADCEFNGEPVDFEDFLE